MNAVARVEKRWKVAVAVANHKEGESTGMVLQSGRRCGRFWNSFAATEWLACLFSFPFVSNENFLFVTKASPFGKPGAQRITQ